MRIKGNGKGRMALRERLDWLMRAIHSGRYGAISTRNAELNRDYCAATGAHPGSRAGELRARQMGQDLNELTERRLLARTRETKSGTTLAFYVYTITEKGEDEADKLMERETA
jgi:hypothetical protein